MQGDSDDSQSQHQDPSHGHPSPTHTHSQRKRRDTQEAVHQSLSLRGIYKLYILILQNYEN